MKQHTTAFAKILIKRALIACLLLSAYAVSAQSIRHYETAINKFRLYDAASLAKYTLQLDQQDSRHTPYNEDFIFTNKDHTAHIRFIHHPGDSKYQMAGIEVRKGIPDEDETFYHSLPDKFFETNNGVTLGIKEQDILDLQGAPEEIIQQGVFKVYCYYESDPKSSILQEYNQAAYVIQYMFRNGILERFNFGFVYP